MEEIKAKKGDNLDLPTDNRTASSDRQWFLRHFVQAQMVAYESAPSDGETTSVGWFFWTLKMEFGAFGEWDFLRGYKEEWVPTLPSSNESTESAYGTCREIAEKTKDDKSIIQEFPDPETHPELWSGPVVDDDFVLSHAGSLDGDDQVKKNEDMNSKSSTTTAAIKNETNKGGKSIATKASSTAENSTSTQAAATKNKNSTDAGNDKRSDDKRPKGKSRRGGLGWFPMFCIVFFAWGIWRVFLKDANFVRNRRQYTNLDTPTQLSV